MASSKIHVGLEIGTSKICMVAGEVKSDGSVKILGVGQSKSVGVRKGEIYDFPQVRACVKDALVKAEDSSDVEIGSVYLAITGSHIQGVNNRGSFRLPDDESIIASSHVKEAKEIARAISIPSDHVYLHHIIRRFGVDGFEHATSPVGLSGKTIDADFHVVHGLRTRIENQIKCVREMPLDIDDLVFSPIASAQVALDREAKERGALVIDIGGGTTDYVLYRDGAIEASGCIPVGGDHITNDIHLITGLAFSKAETLKIREGDASADPARSVGLIKVADEKGFAEAEVKRQLLNEIIRHRMEEILKLLLNRLPEGAMERVGTGVFLSGGSSLMRGFGELAHDVFKRDIYRPEPPELSGVQANFKDPQFTTAIGLIRYAQLTESEREPKRGFLRRLWPFSK
ncbi:MAG: cell division protein FtsA [Verrucomicrobia bacterium]|nr:MAG: cell division protein FtsA [Verrucomicrobiota bacterium]TAE86518.1 MAG: cell division protein FtsA [Verrucomicrobiota bacterium]TAF24154.1 MAG: cell division protein FtsA [Verrucomicrobiota bacterium]